MDFENRTIYEPELPECLKELINKFKPNVNGMNLDLSSMDQLFMQQLNIAGNTLDFFNNQGEYGFRFKTEVLPNNLNAETRASFKTVNGVKKYTGITIVYNELYINRATDLGLAKTTVHELVHAYLFYVMDKDEVSSLGELLDDYLQDLTPNQAQHQIMSEQFAGAIANAIESYDNSANLHVEYDYLSWSGAMARSTKFLLMPQDFQQKAEQRNAAEEGRETIDPSLPNISPIGVNDCQI